MEFSRQEYWSGLPFPPAEDPPNPGIEPTTPASPAMAGGFFITEPPGIVSSKLLEENMGINLQKVKIFKNQRTWQNILQVHRSMDLELGQRWPRILTAMLM